MTEENIKIKFDPYKGILNVDILEFLRELDIESKKELISDGGYWNLIEEAFARDIVNEFSGEHFNPIYTKLRGLILNSEAMPKVITKWAESLSESLGRAKEFEKYWDSAYWELYHSVREYFYKSHYSSKEFFDVCPKLPDHKYGKKYSEGFMKSIEEKIQKWGELFELSEED